MSRVVTPLDVTRPARRGERCCCGRPARFAIILSDGREVPVCDRTVGEISAAERRERTRRAS